MKDHQSRFIYVRKKFLQKLNKLQDYKEVLIEKYIPGREIQVAILGQRKLGAIELQPKRKFYDYKAYDKKAQTKHIIPLRLVIKNLKFSI